MPSGALVPETAGTPTEATETTSAGNTEQPSETSGQPATERKLHKNTQFCVKRWHDSC